MIISSMQYIPGNIDEKDARTQFLEARVKERIYQTRQGLLPIPRCRVYKEGSKDACLDECYRSWFYKKYKGIWYELEIDYSTNFTLESKKICKKLCHGSECSSIQY